MHWKRILGIVAIVIVGLLVAIYAILASYDFNKLKPTITKAAKEATGRELTIGGDIRLKFGFTPALFAENISFQNAPWGSRPELAKIKRFEIQVALFPLIFGKVEVKRLILMEPDILIETERAGQSNLKFEPAKKEELEKKPSQEKKEEPKGKLPALLVNELRIEKGHLVYKDGASGKVYSVLVENLTVSSASWESPVKLELKGSYNSVPIEVGGTLGPLIDLVNPGRAWPLSVNAKAAGAVFKIDGKVQDPAAFRGLEINFSGQGKNLENLQPLIGQPLPVRGPFDISGTVTDPTPKVFKIINLKVKLGESDLKGTVELDLSSQRPALSLQGSSDKLDLRPLLPGAGKEDKKDKKEEKSPPPKTGKKEKVFPSDPLLLGALKAIDAAVKFQAKQVQLSNLAMNDLDLDMTLREGNFDGKKIKAGISGGTLDGRVNLDARGKTSVMTALMKLDQLEISRLLKETKSPEILDGKIDIDLDVMGRGDSIASLMGGLNGKMAVVMGQGKINNKYIEMLGGDLGSSLFRFLNSQ
ncbi:MAG: AsmA family protein [Deltaproteobacteria bacterium]|nr:AsmA family protein [Deltaproteobacteria bacterium]